MLMEVSAIVGQMLSEEDVTDVLQALLDLDPVAANVCLILFLSRMADVTVIYPCPTSS